MSKFFLESLIDFILSLLVKYEHQFSNMSQNFKKSKSFSPESCKIFFFYLNQVVSLKRNTQREFLDPPRKFFLLIYAEPEIPITLAQGNLRGHSKYHRKSKTAIKNSKTEGNFFKTRHEDNALSSMQCKI